MKLVALSLCLAAVCVMGASAVGGFALLDEALKSNPEWFNPGEVGVATLRGRKHFVFAGCATRSFSENLEHDFELWEKAELDAKARFYEYAKSANDCDVKVTMRGCVTLYQFRKGDDYFRVLAVAVKDVSIEKAVCDESKPSLEVPALPATDIFTETTNILFGAEASGVTNQTEKINEKHDQDGI